MARARARARARTRHAPQRVRRAHVAPATRRRGPDHRSGSAEGARLCIAFSEALPDDDDEFVDEGNDAYRYLPHGRVIVDPLDPFLKRSDGSAGPAEASGSIRPADVLLAVNGQDVSQLHFDDVIELLRSLGYGNVLLRFMRESRMKQK